MQRRILYVAFVASIGLNVVGALVNLQFAKSLASSTLEYLLLGSAVVISDVFKATFPFLIGLAWSERRIGSALICICLLPVPTLISATSTVGFSSTIWTTRAGSHEIHLMRYEALRSEFDRTREQLDWKPKHRPEKVIQFALSSMRKHSRWRRSKKCTNATEPKSQEFCRQHTRAQMELTVAQEAETMRRRLRKLTDQIATLPPNAINSQLRPLIDALAQTMVVPPSTAVIGPIILLVLFFEGFTIFGPYVTINSLIHSASQTTHHRSSEVNRKSRKTARKKASTAPRNETNRKPTRQTEKSAVEKFLKRYTQPDSSSCVGATELLNLYLSQRQEYGWPKLSQRRFGDIMWELKYKDKPKDSKTGRTLYGGIRLVSSVSSLTPT